MAARFIRQGAHACLEAQLVTENAQRLCCLRLHVPRRGTHLKARLFAQKHSRRLYLPTLRAMMRRWRGGVWGGKTAHAAAMQLQRCSAPIYIDCKGSVSYPTQLVHLEGRALPFACHGCPVSGCQAMLLPALRCKLIDAIFTQRHDGGPSVDPLAPAAFCYTSTSITSFPDGICGTQS